MVTKKKNRFFGLIPERPAAEHSMPEQPVTAAAPMQPPAEPDNASMPLMRALSLTSHAEESRLTEQEKQMAWELPARIAEPDEALVPRSTSKARLLIPALEQMRQTQSTLMSGFAAVAGDTMAPGNKTGKSPEAPSMENASPRTTRRRTPQTLKPTQPAVTQGPVSAPASLQPTPVQPTPATSQGWEYSVMLQRVENPVPSPAAQPSSADAAKSDPSSISLMFQRLRSHSASPATPPPAAPKAPGFLNKLWAK